MARRPRILFVAGANPDAAFVRADREILERTCTVDVIQTGGSPAQRLRTLAAACRDAMTRRYDLIYIWFAGVSYAPMLAWAASMASLPVVIVTGAMHFDAKIAFDFPENAWTFDAAKWVALGAAARIGIYDYLGYYDICFIGDEVKDPGRTIPRSIVLSTTKRLFSPSTTSP